MTDFKYSVNWQPFSIVLVLVIVRNNQLEGIQTGYGKTVSDWV